MSPSKLKLILRKPTFLVSAYLFQNVSFDSAELCSNMASFLRFPIKSSIVSFKTSSPLQNESWAQSCFTGRGSFRAELPSHLYTVVFAQAPHAVALDEAESAEGAETGEEGALLF